MRTQLLFLTACILPLTVFSQKKADRRMLTVLKQHVSALSVDSAHDSGSSGMLKRISYLENQFRSAGISAVNNTYRQAVIYDEGKKFMPGTSLLLNNNPLQPGQDFIPLSYSAQAEVSGEPLIAVQERNQPWIMDINNYITTAGDSLTSSLYKLAVQAVHDKASAVLFYNSSGSTKHVTFNPNETFGLLPVPVVYINYAAANHYFNDPTASIGVKLTVAFSEKKDTAYNIIGFINNNAAKTILIGAYDAGGQAALIELGRLIKNDKHFTGENYLLVAFAGRKSGTSGIRYFLEHPSVDLSHLQCFINLHHDGSGAANPVLTFKGNITPEWRNILDKMRRKDMAVREDSASGLSHKTDIPVFTFSGAAMNHVSAESELTLIKHMTDLIREINRVAQ